VAVLDLDLQPSPASPAPRGRGLAHVPALDGLRGLAVAGVVAFHLGWIDGGYLGVDAFFVLSGFLITSLLLTEHAVHGRLSLGRFWARRSRRLLPAMLVVVAAVVVWAMAAAPDELTTIRGDAVATLLYVANWHEIATASDYWAIFDAPSPLQHAWSLAIEEQFYLVWPVALAGLAVVARRRRLRLAPVVGVVAVAAAAASYLAMAALAGDGDVTRAYYGTGCRAGAIALGAVLAALVHRRRAIGATAVNPVTRPGLQVAAIVAAGMLAWAWLVAEGSSLWLYRGGFVALGVAVAVVIAAALEPAGPVARALSWAPLRGLGLISYGLYLWHWVVIATVTEARTSLSGAPLTVTQLGLGLGAALVSYRWLEQPIRQRRWLRTPATAVPAALGAYGAAFALIAASTLVPPTDTAELTRSLAASSPPTSAAATVAPTSTTSPSSAPPPSAARTVAPTAAAPLSPAPLPPARVGVFGDSTGLRSGMGLGSYARRTGEFVVAVNAARLGCGVLEGGQRRFAGEAVDIDQMCGSLAQAWEAVLAETPIDVAVIGTGMWETVERRLPGDGSWRRVGDPVLDARLRAELDAANQFWAARGIPVVWLRSPGPDEEGRDPAAMARFNQLLSASVAAFPSATTVALDDFFAALSPADQQRLRPDGIHFGERETVAVADAWLGPELTRAIERVRRAF
jgi:peptidoglycan/LPS O-acetylase OafA/YrhL